MINPCYVFRDQHKIFDRMVYNMTYFENFHWRPNFTPSRAFFGKLTTPQTGKVDFFEPL